LLQERTEQRFFCEWWKVNGRDVRKPSKRKLALNSRKGKKTPERVNNHWCLNVIAPNIASGAERFF